MSLKDLFENRANNRVRIEEQKKQCEISAPVSFTYLSQPLQKKECNDDLSGDFKRLEEEEHLEIRRILCGGVQSVNWGMNFQLANWPTQSYNFHRIGTRKPMYQLKHRSWVLLPWLRRMLLLRRAEIEIKLKQRLIGKTQNFNQTWNLLWYYPTLQIGQFLFFWLEKWMMQFPIIPTDIEAAFHLTL